MVYNATVEAGIEMDKIKVNEPGVINKVVHIEIPKATIQNAKVDVSSIKYFDEKFSLFNVDTEEDSNNAVALAEKSAKEEAAKTGILELADKQSKTLIKGIIESAVPDDYKIQISELKK